MASTNKQPGKSKSKDISSTKHAIKQPSSHLPTTKQSIIAQLFHQGIPENGWNPVSIQYMLSHLSSMDSNNFLSRASVGEREGRCFSDMVARRSYYFLHGIGRSGDLTEPQPKAIGSSILSKFTNVLINNLMTIYNIDLKTLLVPVPVGCSLMLCLSKLRLQRHLSDHIIWFREDNEFIFKSIINGGFTPVILTPNESVSDIELLDEKINEIGPDKIHCVISTTCSLPQKISDIVGISTICKKHAVPHIVISDCALQYRKIMGKIKEAKENGKVSIVLCNASENLLVPTGSSVIASFKEETILDIAKIYPGRASSSSTIDIFITLLSLGKSGYLKLLQDRDRLSRQFEESLTALGEKHKKVIISIRSNQISIAISFATNTPNLLRLRQILSGYINVKTRFLFAQDSKSILKHKFEDWGSHGAVCSMPLIVFQLSIRSSQKDIDSILETLQLFLSKIK